MSETRLSKNKSGVEIAKKYLKKKAREPTRSKSKPKQSKAKPKQAQRNASAFRSSPINDLKVEIDWVNTDRRLGNKNKNKKKFFLTKTGNANETREALQMGEIAAFKSHFQNREGKGEKSVDKVVYDSKNFKVVRKVKGGSDEENKEIRGKDSVNTVKFLSNRIQKEFYMSVEIKRLVKKFKTKQVKQQER